MAECKKCKWEEKHMMAGQGFRGFTCAICGRADVWPNTNIPKICHVCSEKFNICQRCGGSLEEENT